jgi:hypothetical protein
MTASAPSRSAKRLATLLIVGSLTSAWADDNGSLRTQGFVNQRLSESSNGNNFFGDTSGRLSSDFTEIGGGVSWRPFSRWLLAGQAIYRRGGRSEADRLETDYGYAAYTPLASEAGHVTVKLGKIKVPYGLYNELRDNPMTRPGILAPQSIYLDSLRHLNQSAIGLHLEAESMLGDDSYTLRLSQIKPDVSGENTAWSLLGNRSAPFGFQGTLHTRDNEAYASQLAYDHDGGKLRALVSHAQGKAHYQPGGGDLWSGGEFNFAFSALSLQWNGEQVSLSSELARNDFHRHFDSAILPTADSRDIGTSCYAQAQWRFAPRWEGLLRYDVNITDNHDPDGSVFQASTGQPAWLRFAKDWTLGARYRPDHHWLLAGEVHRVHGAVWLPPVDNLSNGQYLPANTSPWWNLFLLQATYQF